MVSQGRRKGREGRRGGRGMRWLIRLK